MFILGNNIISISFDNDDDTIGNYLYEFTIDTTNKIPIMEFQIKCIN